MILKIPSPQLYHRWLPPPLNLREAAHDKVYFSPFFQLIDNLKYPVFSQPPLAIFRYYPVIWNTLHSCISGVPLPRCISAGPRPTRFDIYFFSIFRWITRTIWKYPLQQYLRWSALRFYLRWPASDKVCYIFHFTRFFLAYSTCIMILKLYQKVELPVLLRIPASWGVFAWAG